MKIKIYFAFLIIVISSILINTVGIFNTMTSLKYETESSGNCVSIISGRYLCAAILNMKIMIVVAVVLIYFLLYFQSKIFKTQNK